MSIEQQYKSAKNTINSLRGLKGAYAKCLEDSNVDKFGYSFNEDDRFSIFNLKVSLDGWRGTYGNSSCYTLGGAVDNKLIQKAFIKYLNKNRDSIVEELANMIEQENEETKKEYIESLEKELENLKNT